MIDAFVTGYRFVVQRTLIILTVQDSARTKGRLRMKAISTLFKSVLFLGVCIVSWTILPVLFIVGALALFLYALAVESLHSLISRKPPVPAERAARKVADGMCGTAPQRPTSP
jgi:hypothetical protein